MTKRVALVSLYSEGTKGIPPLGPLYLATALKANNIQSLIIHKTENDLGEIYRQIEYFKPDLVGMSVFTGYLNKNYVTVSKELSKKGYKIVWGNAHPSLLPTDVLNEDYIDFVVIGEGEETLVELTKRFDDKSSYPDIPGLGYKDLDGRVNINKRREYINIDKYLIDWSLINVEDYLVPYFSNRYQRTLAVTTSRGCPFNCQFCYNLVFNNRRWRAHTPEKLVKNLKPVIEKYNIEAIRFLDDNFFVNKERAFQIAQMLGLPYFADSRVEFVDEEFVKNLKKTKCQEVMFGFESGSERILKEVVQKGTTTEHIIKAVSLLKNSGIMASGSIIFGLPTETKEEYIMTIKLISKLLDINNNLAFTCGWYLPYPGTGLYEKAKALGFKPPERLEDWDRLDRWRSDYDMEWLDWDYKSAVKYSRRLIHLLAMSYKRKIPIAKEIFKYRALNLNYFFPLDIYLFSKIRNIYMHQGDKNILYKFIKKFILWVINRSKKLSAIT